ncbi:TetR/AcrR family transcriptional regulator [Propionicimonas sp.]|uniref:TetR/AcrR family transcriptional regulator n=1 Tax=Propionicimonas sp. TaxID=1955623 RepID=UPI00183ED84F|nr:TetR family transcriptional regulator [Propionicimonas sp.]MBU3975857.1 TetR family transcriptional regulator [Actinomycetota bacterium]MBA3022156.1 TetR/AcrR family transcriptional regulator [Propionicimonas sp.]MBU3987407.1 TetR family transcriptional regulator [Actinomycetota bacterium]MBU4006648.1 TetR family transcriptional regulator [Actinomycetota bacterium]MBU4065253.1 TetR family transcriptional regulator [Actinomycetota bacterium]
MGAKRDDLIERATDWAWQHGLSGLSLRPLAAALGTSDRMLLYHLGSKEQLIVEIIRCSAARSAEELRSLRPSTSPPEAVLDQWRLRTTERQAQCDRLYVEASSLGLFGQEPYATEVAAMNEVWLDAVQEHLVSSGVPQTRSREIAELVDAAFMGFELDRPLGAEVPVGLSALARAVDLLVHSA